jgi:formate dehydrogenase subunit beta
MGQFAALTTDGQINRPIRQLLAGLLEQEIVAGVMVPARQPYQQVVMQTLFTDPGQLEPIDPFAPVVPTSSAKVVSSLTHRPTGRKIAVVLRSCELRAFLELVKLHQGNTDDLLLIGIDCLGRHENRDYLAEVERDGELTLTFLKLTSNGGGQRSAGGAEIAAACRACTHPVPEAVDLRLCVIGADPSREIHVEWVSEAGKQAFEALGLKPTDAPAGRAAEVEALVQRRGEFRQQHLAEFAERTKDIEGLARVVAPCINCYNCRVACPVCYCRECVFVTDTMRHDGDEYLRAAEKRGQMRLPTDTLFYHLTRMVHMSTLCVGCGQCTSACPNDVPVWELLSTVADRTQARFDYVPGRSLEEGQPLAVFFPEELDEVTGQVK